MKEIIKSFNAFSLFLKQQLFVGLITQLTWSLIIPLVYKLQGMLWTTTLISIYLILMRASGLFVPYFKGITIKKAYIYLITLSLAYWFGTLLYFFDKNIFLWVEVLLTVMFGIVGQAFGISWDLFVIKEYGEKIFEDYRYCSSIRDSIGGIGGYSLAAIVYSIMTEDKTIVLFLFTILVVVFVQYLNYRINYRDLK